MDEEVRQEITLTPEIRKKANTFFFSKMGFNLLLIVLGAVLIGLFMRSMQREAAYRKQKENSSQALTETTTILTANAAKAEELTQTYHDGNQIVLDDIDMVLSEGLFAAMEDADPDIHSDVFTDIVKRSQIKYLYLMSKDGEIAVSPDVSLYGLNPAVRGILTQENVNQILRGTRNSDNTITPVLVKNQYGTFYFYSKPYVYHDQEYILTTGSDAKILDEQIASLSDVSIVLSRASVINNGFLFAVNKDDGLYRYYKDDKDMLTGQNALASGLTEEALSDGYTGTQTIKGKRYYCLSRSLDDHTVVCAAAPVDTILGDIHYALFWSILGFDFIMIVCLAYTIIVRNDFVRRAVQTDRIELRKDSGNPIYFDKSISHKIFPLMLICVFVMYGISFYTQTLLEVSEGIEKSEVALQEVVGRYEESQESREIIRSYYNDRMLSTARLISFILEERPDILNAPSENYHTGYDEEEDKRHLTDDEGNPLKSVALSAGLQELCDINDVNAIYVFDENGYTIATNTPNWFFAISQDEADQSSEFLPVLDGRTDDYIQEMMVSDLGEETQFTGVAFNYYTTTAEDGSTVYVTRSAYEKAAAENGGARNDTVDGITRHRSMIQIQIDKDLYGRLIESTNVDQILSTNMLNGGYIVMFDTTKDHLCVYSPNEASVGKSADELGISSKAFDRDEYYGFNRINGVTYFQYFRYLNGYYIATAIPKTEMYLARNLIAWITAGISFFLIVILSLTIILTTHEEEMLYEVMSEEEAERDLNAAIFNIVLPSGRHAATTGASARWDNRRIPWNGLSPEQKLFRIIGGIFGLLLLYIFLSISGVNSPFVDRSVIRYIISGSWDRGGNIFALTSCALVLIGTMLVVYLVRIPLRIITVLFGARAETMSHLLLSIFKYGGALGAVFYCLYLLGMDSRNLLTGAGVLTLVVGLGAQSLIQDIIAGIFIVFEGEFRVGDIVTIHDYRGTVMDIGLRTTKIQSPDGNIKIFNNSDISGVLNMTKEASIAACRISIEYGQDLEYVEAVLNRELPVLKEKNPLILDGPGYRGVATLADSGVELIITCKCFEKDVRSVNRYLNREVLQIFYNNGINVPFPNVTVSNLDMEGRKTIEDYYKEHPEDKEEQAK